MPALTPNARLGPYEILDAIGAGGMGEVDRGRDTRLDRIVAIKVLSSALASDLQSRERFDLQVFCQAADGSGQPQLMFSAAVLQSARAIAPDMKWMLLEARGAKTGPDILMATVGPPVEMRPLIQTAFGEFAPAVSPDGRWLAYDSNESGQSEVYVRPFPAVDDVAPDGRFLLHIGSIDQDAEAPRGFVLVQNWFGELKSRVPATPR